MGLLKEAESTCVKCASGNWDHAMLLLPSRGSEVLDSCCWHSTLLIKALGPTTSFPRHALLDKFLQAFEPILLPWSCCTLTQQNLDQVCIHVVQVILLVPALLHGHAMAAWLCMRV